MWLASSVQAKEKKQLTIPIMAGSLVEGSQLPRGQVGVTFVAEFSGLNAWVSTRTNRGMMVFLEGRRTICSAIALKSASKTGVGAGIGFALANR